MWHIDDTDLFLKHEGETIFVTGMGPSIEGVPHDLPGVEITVDTGWSYRSSADYCVVTAKPFDLGQKRRDPFLNHAKGVPVVPSFNKLKWEHWISLIAPDRYKDWLNRLIWLPTKLSNHIGKKPFPNPQLAQFVHHRHSPFLAVGLACYMGARRVCLVGVDCLPPNFNGHKVRSMSIWWRKMTMRLGQPDIGCQIVNSSPVSRLKGMQYRPLTEVMELARVQRSEPSASE